MYTIALVFLVSILSTCLVVRYRFIHEGISGDHDVSGIQKFHSSPVPRIGGLCIFLSVLIGICVQWLQNESTGLFGLFLVLSAAPAFLSGLMEDITKKVSILSRLSATVLSALIAGTLLNAWLNNLGFEQLNHLLNEYVWLSIALTCFAVTGIVNSFNIIDGFNGLSGMVAVIILCALAYVAYDVGDVAIMTAALVMIGAILGFLVWNYPRGLIFLGDGGAYFIGFWIAELSILLTLRNSTISVFFPLLLCMYPIFETLFSIYRRAILRRTHPGTPDSLHLHHLIYKRIVRRTIGSPESTDQLMRNSLTAPYLWGLCLLSVIPAVIFWRDPLVMLLFTLLFIVTYIAVYRKLVKFSSQRWMTLHEKKAK
jgi:UDP-N-acetylmuramyl pentapeptide phosphotransferase/UDP-N-acetylglucosamine-1-phosphate transferase